MNNAALALESPPPCAQKKHDNISMFDISIIYMINRELYVILTNNIVINMSHTKDSLVAKLYSVIIYIKGKFYESCY